MSWPVPWLGVAVNGVGVFVVAALAGAGVAVLAAASMPERVRVVTVGALTALVGAAGVGAGSLAMAGVVWSVHLPELLPLAGVELTVDALGGVFVAVSGAVVAVAAVYGIGYAGRGHGPAGRGVLAALPLFAVTMVLVPFAASVSTFLFLWEAMALTSAMLLVAEHRRRDGVRSAGVWYVAMTQFGFVALLIALTVYASAAGGEGFIALRSAALSPVTGSVVFVLLLVGFGAKAGMVPLHVWLPKAHPQAPSPVSAILSAAMVNLGIYGLIRFGFDLLHGGPQWWWLLVLGAGASSALFGILQAAVATDLKGLLAYSTVENMGLILLGVGASGLLRVSSAQLSAAVLAAALLHLINHAAFKTLLFGAAGSVVRATGVRDLDELGGLRPRMPATTILFAVGALGAVALPPGNGFVSEWLLLQSFVHAAGADGAVTAVFMPVAVAVVALTAGLAVATFTKAFGVGFLARARSAAAGAAVESPLTMVIAMVVAATACAALALVPARLAPGLDAAVRAATSVGGGAVLGGELMLRSPAFTSTVSPLLIAASVLAAVMLVAVSARLLRLRVRRRRDVALWACGTYPPTPRMQYTATSFAEPLQRVFDDVLAPQTDVDITPFQESTYLVERVEFQRRVPDRIEHRLYRPVIAVLARLGRLGPVLANGSVHRYLAYGLVGMTGLLVVLAVLS